jgi:hypothetical protein
MIFVTPDTSWALSSTIAEQGIVFSSTTQDGRGRGKGEREEVEMKSK